jgi:DNA-binding winged helix-turn-helix (wHTH) protein/CheY-like chemotaxis protein
MASPSSAALRQHRLRVGEWTAEPALDQISSADRVVKLEPRTMRLLLALAARPGEVVTNDELLALVWKDVLVTSSSIYEGVAQLRKALGDNSAQPRYIATVPRKGYRLVAAVSPMPERRAVAEPAAAAAATMPADLLPPRASARPANWHQNLARFPVWSPAGLVLLGGLGLLVQNLLQPAAVVSIPALQADTRIDDRTDDRTERPTRILWVDDRPDNNIREREAMAAFKVQFDLALSTEEALQRLRSTPYDLIISDMGRPGDLQAGYTLLQRLRQSGDTTRVVFYTSSCTDAQMQEARTRGALGCSTQISQLMQMALSTLEARR